MGTAERLLAKSSTGLFDLNLDDEQSLIKETLQQFASKMREAADHTDEKFVIDDELWTEFNQLELAFYQVPESLGGMMSERSTTTQMIMAETLAYGDLGQALAFLSPQSVLNTITQWGSHEQQKTLIPKFLVEKPIKASIAVNEPSPLFSPFQLDTIAKKDGDSYVLNGVKNMVPLADSSEFFLIAAKTSDRGNQLFILNKNTSGLTITKDRSMGLNAAQLGQLSLNNVKLSATSLLGEAEGIDYSKFVDFCKLGWCSLAVGCSNAVMDYVIAYANDRFAFGEPISHRQAVAFIIADMKIEIDGMRVLSQRAASKAEHGMDFKREAYLAHLMCSDKCMVIGSNGVQLLGGHGFIRDFPVQRWYRDLRAVAIAANGLHL